MVLALPNASMAGFASMIWSSKEPCAHTRVRRTHGQVDGGTLGWANARLSSPFPPKLRRWQSTG